MKFAKKSTCVKWKIFRYFMLFGAIMLALLWLFQVQFLDDFYQVIKKQAVKDAAMTINKAIEKEEYKEIIDDIVRKNELCVSVLSETYEELYTSNRRDPRCMIDRMKKSEIATLYEEAIANGGSVSRLISTDENRKDWQFHKPIENNEASFTKGKMVQNITYASVQKIGTEKTVIILVNAEITPVDATVGTIRTQLIIITAILLLLAILLAFLISRKIAKPIIETNNSAKRLAIGEYEVAFQNDGYLEIKELNDTLNFAAVELNKVQELQRELIANMSHDLRTPLTMIAGYGEMLRDIPGENTPENVQIIIDETNRLTSLVNDILDLSKLQSGVQNLNIKTFNITEMIRLLIDRYQKMLISKEFEIVFHYDEDNILEGDELKLGQAIYNLINNAMTYCGPDKQVIVIQKNLLHGVRIEIVDHGKGIASDELPYVWERYYKTKQHHIRASVGTGLGLSIVKNVLQLHNANFGVTSEIDKGTIFWIELPNKVEKSS